MGVGKLGKEEGQRREKLFESGILVCGHCKRELPLQMFTKEKGKKNGYSSYCKDCQREQRERRKDKIDVWKENNREKIKEKQKEYSQKHAEKKRIYNQTNKEHLKKKRKEYEQANLEKIQKQRRQYRKKLTTKYKKYKTEAEKRDLVFNLTYEEFENTITKPCYYCGELLEDEFGNRYTGIDRVNSKEGYEVHNIVPCCAECNRMKMAADVGDWIARMEQILTHLEDIGYITMTEYNSEVIFNQDVIKRAIEEM